MPGSHAARVTVWTDASFAARAEEGVHRSRLCWLLSLPSGARLGRVYDIPPSFWERALERSTHIVMAEALAVVMLLRDAPSFLVDHAATFYIDNLSALSGFVMGYSQIADLSGI